MIRGYARVSTRGQTLESQVECLISERCDKIYKETISGIKKIEDRPALVEALSELQKGDILLVTRLDRLARSTLELLRIVEIITEDGATLKSLNDPWLSTDTPSGKLFLTILGALAEFEKSLIIERTADGRERAKLKGTHFGPKFTLSKDQIEGAKALLKSGKTYKEVSPMFGISDRTLRRYVME